MEKTIGKIYGEILRDSGISIKNGRYIGTGHFREQLAECGDLRAKKYKGSHFTLYLCGQRSGIDFLSVENNRGLYQFWVWSFNPWDMVLRPVYDSDFVKNPRKLIEIAQEGCKLFFNLSTKLQRAVYDIFDDEKQPYHLCVALDKISRGKRVPKKISKNIKRVAENICSQTKDEALINMFRDIMFKKGKRSFEAWYVHSGIVAKQIRGLYKLNPKEIPIKWEEGAIRPGVVQQKLLEEKVLSLR